MVIIEARGLDAAVLRINEFGNIDRYGLLSALAETVRKQTLLRFTRTKTAPTGAKWAPLKKPGRGRSAGDILVNTGRLRNSISSRVSGSTASIGTDVHYGKYHQRGTRRMVARPFMGLSATDLTELQQVAERFVAGSLIR